MAGPLATPLASDFPAEVATVSPADLDAPAELSTERETTRPAARDGASAVDGPTAECAFTTGRASVPPVAPDSRAGATSGSPADLDAPTALSTERETTRPSTLDRPVEARVPTAGRPVATLPPSDFPVIVATGSAL